MTEQVLAQFLAKYGPALDYAAAERRLSEKMKPARLVPLETAWNEFNTQNNCPAPD